MRTRIGLSAAALCVAVCAVAVAVPVASVDAAGRQVELRPTARAKRIVMLGDSLAIEASPVVGFLTAPKALVPRAWGGTAPCDWAEIDLMANRSSVVVISFTGNSLTPCMSDGAGGFLHGQALVDKYRADLAVLVERARVTGARVLLVGQPLRAASFDADAEVEGINAIYRELAAAKYVSFVDAGGFVEDGGSYTESLPCSPIEPVCGDDGFNVVRGDGVHFCPVADHIGWCPVWSSGAFRFGLVISAAANNPAAFE